MMKEDKGLGLQTTSTAQQTDLKEGRSTTADVSVLRSLLARVETATGPDRRLDIAIWAAIQGVTVDLFDDSGPGERIAWAGDLRWPELLGQPEVTMSLDAALGLVERVLPGSYVGVQRNRGKHVAPWYGYVCVGDEPGEGDEYEGFGCGGALALLAALLSALIATPTPDQPACEASGAAKVVGKVPGRD